MNQSTARASANNSFTNIYMALKPFSRSFLAFYRFVRRRLLGDPIGHYLHHRQSSIGTSTTADPKHMFMIQDKATLILDVEGGLLRSPSTFPYFMLIAIEAGSLLRGLILLCIFPLLCCVARETGSKIMVMVCFLGLKEEQVARVARATLPKYFLEDVGMEGHEVVMGGAKRVVGVCGLMPRVMVEAFLKEYYGDHVEVVVGRDVKVVRGRYVGLLEKESEAQSSWTGLQETSSEIVIGFGCSSSSFFGHHQQLFSRCKEVQLVTREEKRKWSPLPREQYPRPLIFHDGRLAFRPTPEATLAMFMWLPLSIPLTVIRTLVFVNLPYSISVAIGSVIGVTTRVIINNSHITSTTEEEPRPQAEAEGGRLYVCNHRTLLDPVYISVMLNKKQVSTVTYSVSRVSELISPIRTARLTRNRDEDRRRMEQLLRRGDLVICPEGTTCREPYLLRFSPLFVELVDEVCPVALMNWSGMFHGTSTGKSTKYLDHFYYFMNPRPAYDVEFMEKMATRVVTADGRVCENYEVANLVQGEIGGALGFEPTKLTRRDKYLMLAGNEGDVVVDTRK